VCGIVGIAGQHESAWVQQMNHTIRHRGPDDQGEYRSPDKLVSLAMRRLSILDLQHGHQPVANEDGTVWVVFNGEIFNSPEIRCRLEAAGHRFATQNSDTEVLVHLYEEKGPSMVDDLNGMFAFVIHDQKRNLLFGARDRMGIKPLYYYQSANRFSFASELKALLTLPFVDREIDQQSLFDYMTLLYVPDQASIIKGVFRLPPATHFIYDLKTHQLRQTTYWQLEFGTAEPCRKEETPEFLHSELRSAVKRWTLSDVPIACSLSGGIDSAAIVGLLSELGYPKIKTYSLGFIGEETQRWNEINLARKVACRWGTEHHEIMLEPEELLSDLLSMVWHLDEPYGGGLPSWYVFKAMSKDVKVALTGTGGDELFGNYGKFQVYEEDRLVKAPTILRQWSPAISNALAKSISPVARLTQYLPSSWPWVGRGHLVSQLPAIVGQPFGYYYYANAEFFSDERKRTDVLRTENVNVRNTSAYLQALYDNSRATNARNGVAAVDFRTQLAEEFLFMTDRFSMAHSLEARVPFLDHTLVEKIFQIPSSVRTRPDDLKYLFKKAIGSLLPSELLTTQKRGFVIPLQVWLRGALRPLVERLLCPERLQRQGLFRSSFFDTFVRPHLEHKADFTWQIWAALMFQLWYVVFIEQKEVEAPAYDWHATI
jgi:asparagine synthase (glutamine-hydrolysing)